MALFLLIRHGDTDWVGTRLAGRLPGIHLNGKGRLQARELAVRLASLPIDCVCTSPLERARETAEPLIEQLRIESRISPGLTEVDYGEWAGRKVEELREQPLWRAYHAFRSGIRIPGGELQIEIQCRMIRELVKLQQEYPTGLMAVFSHGDPIKTAIAHWAGLTLDYCPRLIVDTASVSMISVDSRGAQILGLNCTGEFSLPI